LRRGQSLRTGRRHVRGSRSHQREQRGKRTERITATGAMPPKRSDQPKSASVPLYLITGDDDFGVKARARLLYDQWCKESGGFDNELIDATASNSSAALDALAKL